MHVLRSGNLQLEARSELFVRDSFRGPSKKYAN